MDTPSGYCRKFTWEHPGCGRQGMQLVSSFKITKGSKEFFTHPVIHHGVLYIRHGEALMAYLIRKNA